MSAIDQAKDAAFFLAVAFTKRRLYASDSASVRPTLERLMANLAGYYVEANTDVLSIGAMAQGISLGRVPLLNPPDSLARFASFLRQRGFGVVEISRGVSFAELETLIALLNLEAEEVAGADAAHWLASRGAEHVAVKHLELAERKVPRSMKELYAMGQEMLGVQLKRVSAAGKVELNAVREFARAMLDMVVSSDVPIATMVAMRDRDDGSYLHSVNVSVLAGAQAASLGLTEAQVREISIAALLHDVGKTMLPAGLLQKQSALTATEKGLLRRHSEEGARILMRSHGNEGLEAVVAAEHHLPFTENPHLASQIVAVADVFDCLRSLRPFSDREMLRQALQFMVERTGRRLNPYLVQRFCTMCGMYAPGDVVQLSTGEIGQVVSTHVELGARPVLEIIDAAAGRTRRGTLVDLSRAETLTMAPPAPAFQHITLESLEAMG